MSLTQPYDFRGKTALITGASGGLGEQFARCLHARGARVILASRHLDKLKDLSDELGNAKAIEMDVADKKSVISCFSELEAAGEKIDICVNNAGIAKLTPIFGEEQNDDFELTIQTNLMGVWYVTKAVANHMKSSFAFLPKGDESCAAKGLRRSLKRENCLSVCPVSFLKILLFFLRVL